ncbi:sulfonate ABC transporter periplasmic sulfonate-binding protein SsuA [Paraburkholderia atlantica]|uniref:Sulfonate ABC transporter periplasmic sulfonate-binding protein SsuA n=1 Tax=Paraburkholderia atlantica TaxID=2654982 RepID=D5WK34_PARAM|nr:sulfonate ABC transporter substrate-binding protein [Paraburkholderia atlantica]ADG19580.1 sulfonate ABC transporter periplasmic sulfonate-binding protein SsuA [Paraburkholderia atlantica]
MPSAASDIHGRFDRACRQTAQCLSQNTAIRLEIWTRALPRLESGVHYPLTDEVVKAQQDCADLAYREHVVLRKIDAREAIVDIR